MIKYRKSEVADAEFFVKARISQWDEEGQKYINGIEKNLFEYYSNSLTDGSFVAYLAEDDGKIISCGGVCFYSIPPTFKNINGKVAYVTNFYTYPEYRGRGAASEILKIVLDYVKSLGYSGALLHSSDYGKPVYVKQGFKENTRYMTIEF